MGAEMNEQLSYKRTSEFLKSVQNKNIIDTKQEISNMEKSFQELCEAIVDVLIPIVQKCVDIINQVNEAIMNTYPNRRVVHLALYHPKERIRKKNRKRILKWVTKQLAKVGEENSDGD